MEFSVGKYTLESLTSGMYLDPVVLYREYLQNSFDSIDEAVETGLFHDANEGIIEIELDKENNRITIQDNGLGVPENRAVKILLDIGNSQKFKKDRRGFRGIGRLVGLSYTDKLEFETSFKGEGVATTISFDSLRLRELLVPGLYEDYDIMAVIREVTTVTKKSEEPSEHYFRITLEGIQSQKVIDKDIVEEYISEVAPVPYSPTRFSYGESIHKAFIEEKLKLNEYKILLRNIGERWEQIFKLNRDHLISDRQRKIWDYVNSIQIEKIFNDEGSLVAIGWFSKTNFLGTIVDKNIKGIRLRKGNILIGDETTLNSIFKEPRFNGWFQGEMFVIDKNIIPNARRDNFERNETYNRFYQELLRFGEKLSKLIRDISTERNYLKEQAKNDIEKVSEVEKFKKHLSLISADDNNSVSTSANHSTKLFNLLNKSNNNAISKYSALNIADNLTAAEKRLLEKVFNILENSVDERQREDIIFKILSELRVVR